MARPAHPVKTALMVQIVETTPGFKEIHVVLDNLFWQHTTGKTLFDWPAFLDCPVPDRRRRYRISGTKPRLK